MVESAGEGEVREREDRSRSEEVESGFGLGPGWAGLGRVREGWRPAARVVEVGEPGGVVLWPWALASLASNRWRGRSKEAKDETRG